MTKLLPLTLAVSLALGSMPALAAGSDTLQLTDAVKAQITAQLTADGYQVGKIKIEDGAYEAYARKDGKRLEVLLDANLKVIGVKDGD